MEVEKRRKEKTTSGKPTNTRTQPRRKINIPYLITNPNDPTDQKCKDLIDAITCKKCKRSMSGAVVLPCGCFCLCQDCGEVNLPQKCPACNSLVKGACRTFLS